VDREIVSTRIVMSPPDRVFRACTDAARLAQWWGPHGFTNTFHEFDPRPGGRWRSTMHGADGTEYPITREFIEVTPARRLVVRHEQGDHSFTTTMTFEERDGATMLTWRMLFDLASEVEKLGARIRVANEENFDRLEQHLREPEPQT
jgi:uncharacterized protein YndB with AHSA1/START domain